MAAKLILVLAFGILVTDAYRPITFTMKRQEMSTQSPMRKHNNNDDSMNPKPKAPAPEVRLDKKNLLQNMNQNELRSLDFWRTLSNYLEEQPVIILSGQDVERQLEYIQDQQSEYY